MKATGIMRRVDDLGRVVIPKEIRRNLGIREGEALEIYTNPGEVIFRKCEVDRLNDLEQACDNLVYDCDMNTTGQIRKLVEQIKKIYKENQEE